MKINLEALYLVWPKIYMDDKKNVNKIGRSDYLISRLKNYPHESEILFTISCDKSRECEKEIKIIFNQKYKLYCGEEYFEGDSAQMIIDIKIIVCQICNLTTIPEEIINIHTKYFITVPSNRNSIKKQLEDFENKKKGIIVEKKVITKTITTTTTTIIKQDNFEGGKQADGSYKCEKCNMIFYKKSTYDYHMNRKMNCIVEYNKVDGKYECKFCSIEYSKLDLIKKHLEKCYEKIKIDKDNQIEQLKIDKDNQIEQLKIDKDNQIEQLKEKIKEKDNEIIEMNMIIHDKNKIIDEKNKIITELNKNNKLDKKTIKNTKNTKTINLNNKNSNNITTTNTNSNNVTKQTIIVNFGKENIEKLSRKDIYEILTECMFSIPKCIEKVHFNDAIPEQKNTYISNLKADYGFKYQNGNFVATDVNELVNEIFAMRKDDVAEMLESIKENNDIKLSKTKIDRLEYLLEQLDNEDLKHTEEIKKEIVYTLYNNRNKVMNK